MGLNVSPNGAARQTEEFRQRRDLAACSSESRDSRLATVIERAMAGDRDAIRQLYLGYADSILSYVRRIVHDDYEAEDITQAVFTKVFGGSVSYEQREVPFLAWMLRVARNLALDEIRRRRRLATIDLVDSQNACDEGIPERQQSLLAAVRGLPRDQRRVVVLRHINGLAPSEIAESLGKSESSIHGLHHRGRGALRQALIDLDTTPTTSRLRTRVAARL